MEKKKEEEGQVGGRELINVIVINLWLVLISIQYSRNVPDKCYCNKLMASPHIKTVQQIVLHRIINLSLYGSMFLTTSGSCSYCSNSPPVLLNHYSPIYTVHYSYSPSYRLFHTRQYKQRNYTHISDMSRCSLTICAVVSHQILLLCFSLA